MTDSTKKILIVVGTLLAVVLFAICSILIANASYKIEKENERKEQEKQAKLISNLTVIDIDKLEELFSSNQTQIILVASLECPHCTAFKPKINELAANIDNDIYYFELSTLTKEETQRFYNVNEFLNQGTAIPLVMAVKDNKVIDSFTGNIEKEDVLSFLKKNLNID